MCHKTKLQKEKKKYMLEHRLYIQTVSLALTQNKTSFLQRRIVSHDGKMRLHLGPLLATVGS